MGTLASSGGCKSTEELCEQYDCDTFEQLYSSKPTTGLKQYECHGTENDADYWCHSIAGKEAVFISCAAYGDEDGDSETGAGAPAWDPSSSVTYDATSGHYLVDESFVEALKEDPGLILLDSTRVAVSATGYYELESVTQGDLAAAMGLQSGDVLMSANSYSLSSIDDMVDAYYALENETTFTLTILRNSQSMTLTYDVVE